MCICYSYILFYLNRFVLHTDTDSVVFCVIFHETSKIISVCVIRVLVCTVTLSKCSSAPSGPDEATVVSLCGQKSTLIPALLKTRDCATRLTHKPAQTNRELRRCR